MSGLELTDIERVFLERSTDSSVTGKRKRLAVVSGLIIAVLMDSQGKQNSLRRF